MASGLQQNVTSKKPIRHALWFAVVWLLIGAAINVGVAWALTLVPRWSNHSQKGWEIVSDKAGPWLAWMPPDCNVPAYESIRVTYFGSTLVVQMSIRPGVQEPTLNVIYTLPIFQFGVPFRSVQFVADRSQVNGLGSPTPVTSWPRAPSVLGVLELGVPVGGSGTYQTSPNLPLIPVWPGFLLNTLIYAMVAIGAWTLLGALRRARRLGQGMCVACGYALAGLAPGSACPECGRRAVIESSASW